MTPVRVQPIPAPPAARPPLPAPVAMAGLATANPPRYATGREAYDFFTSHFPLAAPQRELYRRILLEGPIRGRYIAIDDDEQVAQASPDAQNERFIAHGRRLAAQAAQKAMAAAGLEADQLGGVVVNTCTGYACPGLSSYLVEDLVLRPGVKTMDLMGMGCGAAIPNLECAAGLAPRADGPVLSVAVEICSATMFIGPCDDLVVSNCIFGDGAAAAIVTPAGEDADAAAMNRLLTLIDFQTAVFPQHRQELRYRSEQGRLRNVLSRRVPIIGARAVAEVADALLARHRLKRQDIDWWAVHPGGSAVLQCVGEEMGLQSAQLEASYEVLREYGNMSSPSVLFVLDRILARRPVRGQKVMLLAFGAGFSAFAALGQF